jgi:hypothetical protein
MTMTDEWQKQQRRQLAREGKSINDLPKDVIIRSSKRIWLHDDVLRLLFKIKRINKNLKSDKKIIKIALTTYLKRLESQK